MTTPRTRATVSLAAAMAVTLALGACAPGPSGPAIDRPASLPGRPLTIRFHTHSPEYGHVYLVQGRDRPRPLAREHRELHEPGVPRQRRPR